MRHLELLPILHYEVHKYYQLDDDKDEDGYNWADGVNREALTSLAEKHKDMLEDRSNEQLFINKVVEEYEPFLTPDQRKTE